MKKRIPIYFNKEFLKFNPIMYAIKDFKPIHFFVVFPLIGFLLGLFAGLLKNIGWFKSDNFLYQLLTHRTYFDKLVETKYELFIDFLGISNSETFLTFIFIYLIFAFVMSAKLMFLYYVFVKFLLIFTLSKEELTFDAIKKAKTQELKGKVSDKLLEEIIQESYDMVQLMKRY